MQYYMPTKGDTFRSIFYPSYSAVSHEGNVYDVTGLSSSFWTDFSVAVLCQSIYWQTSDARGSLNRSKVDTAVTSHNNQVKAKAVAWYAYVLFHDYMNYQGNLSSAKQVYLDQLNSDHWVTYKKKQLIDGSWSNPDWELFHHWVKLSALGASDTEISNLIAALKQKGLIIESDVDASHWRSYFVWYDPSTLDHSDVDSEARNGELASVHLPSPQGAGSWMKEENCYDFTAGSQPGNGYRNPPPHSSCLSANVSVLMASGSFKPIRDISAGEMVKTPHGSSRVLLVSTPKTGDRSVCRINNLPFYFTEAHPFLSFSKDPRYVAVSSLNLLNNVPLLGQYGIGPLKVGTELLAYDGSKITVTSLETVKPDKNDEFVYDLIIEPSPEGKFEYFAGSESNCFAIASEISPASDFSKAERLAFQVIMAVISSSAELLNKQYKTSSDHSSFLYSIDRIARIIEAGFLHVALNYSANTLDLTKNELLTAYPLPQLIAHSTSLYQGEDGTYNQSSGAAYDFFMRKLFYPIASTLELGYRVMPTSNNDLEYLAISIMEVYVVGPIRLPPDPIVTIRIPTHEPFNEIGRKTESVFGSRFHQTHYLPLPKANQDNFGVILNIPISSKGMDGSLTATTVVSAIFQHGFIQRRRLPLFDGKNVEQGYTSVDIRTLTAKNVDIETKKADKWDESSQEYLASQIEKACTSIFPISEKL